MTSLKLIRSSVIYKLILLIVANYDHIYGLMAWSKFGIAAKKFRREKTGDPIFLSHWHWLRILLPPLSLSLSLLLFSLSIPRAHTQTHCASVWHKNHRHLSSQHFDVVDPRHNLG